jgi:RNA polymerase sigma-70 factor (ECF subfamily)
MAAGSIAELYRSHGHIVMRRARRILGNDADAHELTQELFASLVEDDRVLAEVRSPAAWLYTAATTRSLQWLRNRNNRQRLLDERATTTAPTVPPGADQLAAARQVLAQMPEDLATAVVLFHLDEMTHEEIAQVLGMSRRNVGLVLERAQRWIAAQEGSHVAS